MEQHDMRYTPRTARNTTVRADTIHVERWLVVKENGVTRVSNTYPSLCADEVAVALNVTLPRSVFKKPMLQASIVVPEGDPAKITPAVRNQVADVLKAGGFVVEVTAAKPKTERKGRG
jgi:hypothetical protein